MEIKDLYIARRMLRNASASINGYYNNLGIDARIAEMYNEQAVHQLKLLCEFLAARFEKERRK